MANMNLVTGYIGSNHVTATDAGSFHAAIFGDGQYLLNRGQKLSATIMTNNQLRIFDGDLVMQGRHVRINEGDYVDLTIENGATDYNRNDLVVARYTKDASSGVETVNLAVIKGNAVTGTAKDPAYTSGDIMNDGAVLNDMPLYRIEINGLNIVGVTLLAEEASTLQGVAKNVAEVNGKMPSESEPLPVSKGGTGVTTKAGILKAIGAAKIAVNETAIFQIADWVGDAAPYTNTVSLESILESDKPIIDLVFLSTDTTEELVELRKENWALIDKIETGAGTLTAYSYSEIPTRAIKVNVLVVR